jgi:hypothetical protein
MENHSIFTATGIAEKIAEIGSGRRGRSKILVQKTGVLNYHTRDRRLLYSKQHQRRQLCN